MSSKSEPAKTSRNQAAEAPSRPTRTLREKTLVRAATALPPTTSKTTAPKPLPPLPEPESSPQSSALQMDDLKTPDSQAAGGGTQDEMETSSVGSETSIERRVSLLYTYPKRGTGGEMDVATKVANDMLLRGKESLETAGNMKRENKTVALNSLQGLYETVLSLADSRSRHKFNLEKERSRHAQELVRVERAHSAEVKQIKEALLSEVSLARAGITETLKETQAVRSWLGYETVEPFSQLKELHRETGNLVAEIKTKLSAKELGSESRDDKLSSL
ncbi:unnamed protein product [Colias eurytheme]|nr:unnamed protein product [Colias eurytheme]